MRRMTRVLLPALCVLVLSIPLTVLGATETSHTEKSFPAPEGGTVTIDASFHRIEVEARPGSTVDVAVDLEISASSHESAARLLADFEPRFETRGDTVVIRSSRKKTGWKMISGTTRGRITVSIPPGVDLVVDNSSGAVVLEGDFGEAEISVDNSSGRVSGTAAMKTLEVDNSSGGVEITVLRPLEAFDVDCSSGPVRLEGGALEAEIDVSSGSVMLEGLLGNAEVDGSSGSVDLSWSSIEPGAVIEVDVSSGSVDLRLPRGTLLAGEIDTSSGKIRSDFPCVSKQRNHCQFRGGSDAVRLVVDTSSGSVHLAAGH